MRNWKTAASYLLVMMTVVLIPLDSVSAITANDYHSVLYQTPFFDEVDNSNACADQSTGTSATTSGGTTSAQTIAQTFIIGFDASTPKSVITDLATKYHIGGMYLTGTSDAAKAGFTKDFYASLGTAAGSPLVAASDEEGVVTRYSYPAGSFPTAKKMASLSDKAVQAVGQKVGKDMAANGITADLAPVLDLRDVGTGLAGRSFSSKPSVVSEKAGAFAAGLQSSGVTPIFKHFPGFDSTTTGSTDNVKVRMTGSIANTVKPYQDLITKYPNAGVMLSNMYVNKLDPNLPTSLSAKSVTYLRGTIGFSGLITTDDLNVPSVGAKAGSLPKAVTTSLAAGVTMPLFHIDSSNNAKAEGEMDAIVAAVSANKDAMATITASAPIIKKYKGAVTTGAGTDLTAASCCDTGAVALVGNDNLTKVYNFLVGKGLTANQAIGIIGGLLGESHLDPKIDQASQKDQDAPTGPGEGYGIAQWTTAGRQANLLQYAQDNNGPQSDLGIQLGFLWKELTGSYKSDVYTPITATNDIQTVVNVWVAHFEVPADIPGQQAARYKLALDAQKTLQGAGASSGGSGSTDTTTSGDCGSSGGSSTLSKAATGDFEYILKVPSGGVGHDTYYANQVTDIGANHSEIVGDSACGLTSLLMVEASLQGTPNPKLDADGLYKGMSAAGAYSNDAGIKSTGAFLSYIKSIGFKEKPILPERTSAVTDSVLASVKAALGNGQLIIAHTSNAISGISGGSTSGHYLVVYAVDKSGNFYVANPGQRIDSPKDGHPFPPSKIKTWLDGFYAVGN